MVCILGSKTSTKTNHQGNGDSDIISQQVTILLENWLLAVCVSSSSCFDDDEEIVASCNKKDSLTRLLAIQTNKPYLTLSLQEKEEEEEEDFFISFIRERERETKKELIYRPR